MKQRRARIHQFRTRRRRAAGFTLLQVLIVLVIVGIISAFSFRAYRSASASGRRAQCDVHLKALALALDAFKQERGYYPAKLQDLAADKYIPDTELLSCPSDPRDQKSYEDFYVVRGPRDKEDLPILVCPFHEEFTHGQQAYVGRYTSSFTVSPATLDSGNAVTVEHPGQSPIAAPAGMVLHGADRIRTGPGGFAKIVFADGSSADLAQNTDTTLLQSFIAGMTDAPTYVIVRQTVGTVQYQVHKGSKFDVTTPTATAGALGTHFEVRVIGENGTTYVQCTEGTVRMTTRSGSDVIENGTWNFAENNSSTQPSGRPPRRPRHPPAPPPPP